MARSGTPGRREPRSTPPSPDTTPVEPPTEATIRPKPDSRREELNPDATIRLKPDSTYDDSARMTYAEQPLFASTGIEEPPRRSGLTIWFAAAASLVLGILIGFASGYRAGQGSPGAPATIAAPAPASGAASPGQPFSESSVSDPVRPESKAIVPAPSPSTSPARPPGPSALPGAPAPAPTPRPAPAPPRQAARPPAAVEEKPQPTGPGSLQVVSRPAGAEVIVDGKSVGRTPLSIEVSPGGHDVRLALPGFKAWATTVDVKPGSPTRVSGSLEQ